MTKNPFSVIFCSSSSNSSRQRSSPVAAVSLCCLLSILLNACHLLAMHDSYPLLAGVLRTYQTNACDTETIKLECEARTVVSIVVAQYGHPAQPHMCRNVVAARAQQQHQQQHQHQHQQPQQHQLMLTADEIRQNYAVPSRIEEEEEEEDELMQADADPGTGTGYKGRKGRFRFNKTPKSSNSSSSSSSSSSSGGNNKQQQQPKCFDADRLRYNFLRKVERTCRDQYRCNVTLTPANLDLKVDPCAEHVKYAEVAYKCRPKLFRNKIVCEGNSTRLFCTDPDDRLAIFSAFYGSQYEPNNLCLPPGAVRPSGDQQQQQQHQLMMMSTYHNQSDRCETAGATETVMKLCSGRRECTVTASAETFGVPKCPPSVAQRPTTAFSHEAGAHLSYDNIEDDDTDDHKGHEYLLHNYHSTAINNNHDYHHHHQRKRRSPFERLPSSSSSTVATYHVNIGGGGGSGGGDDDDHDHDKGDSDHYHHPNGTANGNITEEEKEPQLILMDAVGSSSGGNFSPAHSLGNAIDETPNPHANCSELPASMHVIGFVSDWISAVGFVKKNRERLILYLLVSLFGAMVCFLAVLSTKLYRQKRRAKRRAAEEQAGARPPLAPFDIVDFDEEDDLDDLDGLPGGPAGPGGSHYPLDSSAVGPTFLGPSHRQFSYHVPQETPSMSILAESNNNNNNGNSSTPTNARPLLYSTLRKKPALKNTTTNTVPTNTGPLATTTTSNSTTSTFGGPTNPLEQQQQPWNTATANIITTAAQIMPMTTMTTSSPPTIIDYGLTLPSSMMPPSQSSIPVTTTTTTTNGGGTLPRKGILSNRHSTGSGILRNANTQTAMIISEEEEDGNNGNGGLMIISSGGGPGPGPGLGHPGNVVAFVDNGGDIGGGGGGYVAGGFGDTNEEDGKEAVGGSFSTIRRVVPVFTAETINGSGGSATPLLITRFEEQGLEMLELEHPGRRQQQQQQHQPGHTEPKTLSTSLNNFFM
ncbi:hypothetical protein TYRP_023250 [Tyrophagus putrescentiae]|nr:hypothetical protein TYRP_023250 [Tyrophagus putrescentiae]